MNLQILRCAPHVLNKSEPRSLDLYLVPQRLSCGGNLVPLFDYLRPLQEPPLQPSSTQLPTSFCCTSRATSVWWQQASTSSTRVSWNLTFLSSNELVWIRNMTAVGDIFTFDHEDRWHVWDYRTAQLCLSIAKENNCQSVRLELLGAEIHTKLWMDGLRCLASTLVLSVQVTASVHSVEPVHPASPLPPRPVERGSITACVVKSASFTRGILWGGGFCWTVQLLLSKHNKTEKVNIVLILLIKMRKL